MNRDTPQSPDLEAVRDEITEADARMLEAFGPLEMARIINGLLGDLAWLNAFATVRSQDDSKTFARVNRGALRTIAERSLAAMRRTVKL